MFILLQERWASNKEVTDTLAHFAERPKRYKAVLEDILQEQLAEDKDLITKLSRLTKEITSAE